MYSGSPSLLTSISVSLDLKLLLDLAQLFVLLLVLIHLIFLIDSSGLSLLLRVSAGPLCQDRGPTFEPFYVSLVQASSLEGVAVRLNRLFVFRKFAHLRLFLNKAEHLFLFSLLEWI